MGFKSLPACVQLPVNSIKEKLSVLKHLSIFV